MRTISYVSSVNSLNSNQKALYLWEFISILAKLDVVNPEELTYLLMNSKPTVMSLGNKAFVNPIQ